MLLWKRFIERLDTEDPLRAQRRNLRAAGLSEKRLRAMDPDARVEALEQAQLDPYDYIFLAY